MMKTACDESYRDPTNLQTKLQKHQAFEAELAANKGRVDGVCGVGQELIDHTHYASHEIEGHIVALHDQWRELDDKWAPGWSLGFIDTVAVFFISFSTSACIVTPMYLL